MPTDTQPKLDDDTITHWPPLAHIARGRYVREGQEALCGAKMMGIKLPDASKVCDECVEVFKRELREAADGND